MVIDKNQLKIVNYSDYPNKIEATQYIASQNYSSSPNFLRSLANHELSGYEASFLISYRCQLIGFFQIKREDGLVDQPYEPWLCRLFVDENYRGNRITTIVTKFASEYGKKFDFHKIYLSTNHQNLYEKFGWQKIGSGIAKSGATRDIFVYTQQ